MRKYHYCANIGCGNETVAPRKSSKGYYIHYRYCSVCNNLRTMYGISKPERDSIIESQKGLCAICKNKLEPGKQTLKGDNNKRVAVVDNCHKTNKVRGVLCSKCNRGLGLFEDNTDFLRSAILYLLGEK